MIKIKNTIGTAHSISLDQNVPLSAEHIRTVLEVARDWSKARDEQNKEVAVLDSLR